MVDDGVLLQTYDMQDVEQKLQHELETLSHAILSAMELFPELAAYETLESIISAINMLPVAEDHQKKMRRKVKNAEEELYMALISNGFLAGGEEQAVLALRHALFSHAQRRCVTHLQQVGLLVSASPAVDGVPSIQAEELSPPIEPIAEEEPSAVQDSEAGVSYEQIVHPDDIAASAVSVDDLLAETSPPTEDYEADLSHEATIEEPDRPSNDVPEFDDELDDLLEAELDNVIDNTVHATIGGRIEEAISHAEPNNHLDDISQEPEPQDIASPEVQSVAEPSVADNQELESEPASAYIQDPDQYVQALDVDHGGLVEADASSSVHNVEASPGYEEPYENPVDEIEPVQNTSSHHDVMYVEPMQSSDVTEPELEEPGLTDYEAALMEVEDEVEHEGDQSVYEEFDKEDDRALEAFSHHEPVPEKRSFTFKRTKQAKAIAAIKKREERDTKEQPSIPDEKQEEKGRFGRRKAKSENVTDSGESNMTNDADTPKKGLFKRKKSKEQVQQDKFDKKEKKKLDQYYKQATRTNWEEEAEDEFDENLADSTTQTGNDSVGDNNGKLSDEEVERMLEQYKDAYTFMHTIAPPPPPKPPRSVWDERDSEYNNAPRRAIAVLDRITRGEQWFKPRRDGFAQDYYTLFGNSFWNAQRAIPAINKKIEEAADISNAFMLRKLVKTGAVVVGRDSKILMIHKHIAENYKVLEVLEDIANDIEQMPEDEMAVRRRAQRERKVPQSTQQPKKASILEQLRDKYNAMGRPDDVKFESTYQAPKKIQTLNAEEFADEDDVSYLSALQQLEQEKHEEAVQHRMSEAQKVKEAEEETKRLAQQAEAERIRKEQEAAAAQLQEDSDDQVTS